MSQIGPSVSQMGLGGFPVEPNIGEAPFKTLVVSAPSLVA